MAEVAEQPRLASCTVVAQGPKLGAPGCPGHQQNQAGHSSLGTHPPSQTLRLAPPGEHAAGAYLGHSSGVRGGGVDWQQGLGLWQQVLSAAWLGLPWEGSRGGRHPAASTQ